VSALMNPMIHLIPLGLSGVGWYLLYRLNRRKDWFRVGEVIFWDAIILILVFLVWLIWF
tara:strand:+ start:34 stop:210 length:177 start_codon:yes stop_codon:yes gene_type:complete